MTPTEIDHAIRFSTAVTDGVHVGYVVSRDLVYSLREPMHATVVWDDGGGIRPHPIRELALVHKPNPAPTEQTPPLDPEQAARIAGLSSPVLLYAITASPCPAFAEACVLELERRATLSAL